MTAFGDFLTDQRLKNHMTLRTFCLRFHEDPVYWSRLERGMILPPRSDHSLLEIAGRLNVQDKEAFLTLARSATLAEEKPFSPPIVLDPGLSEEKIKALYKLIKDEQTPRKED